MAAWKKIALTLAGLALLAALACGGLLGPCWSAWWRDGVLVRTCPAGTLPFLRVEADRLGRGVRGEVRVTALGQLYDDHLTEANILPLRRFSPSLFIVAADGSESELATENGWSFRATGEQYAAVFLPETLPDGDYLLRVRAEVPGHSLTLDSPLPLYRPAVEHLLTDSPLYKPGQVVRVRTVVLASGSLMPAASRPGRWQFFDPSGELVYEEKATTGPSGEVDTTFPLPDDAEAGTWAVGFATGSLESRREFSVRPFRLPRFTVVTTPSQSWYGVGSAPAFRGVATYASGAPVQFAPVSLSVASEGAWPPPAVWLEPRQVVTDASGAFSVAFPPVPTDMVGRVSLRVRAAVTEEGGERAVGEASALLSLDPVAVEAVTELGDGLVSDTNNRLYLRVTSPDGTPIPNAAVHVRPEWDKRAPEVDATTDAGAVARLQLDPGAPVLVTEPVLPIRPPPPPAPVVLSDPRDVAGSGSELELRRVAETLTWRWARCASEVGETTSGTYTARVAMGGVTGVWSAALPAELTACMASTGGALPITSARLIEGEVTFEPPPGARLQAAATTFSGNSAAPARLEHLVKRTRSCASVLADGPLPSAWLWETSPGSLLIRVQPVAGAGEGALEPTARCVTAALAAARLDVAEDQPSAGLLTASNLLSVGAFSQHTDPVSGPGFSFIVRVDGRGETVLRLPVGAVPSLRLRFSEVVVNPGDEVTLTAVRGPDFAGTLPESLSLLQGDRLVAKFAVDAKNRSGTFKIPDDASGFASVEWSGARAVLYVRPAAALHVGMAVSGAWKPGQTGGLSLTTTGASGPVAASVSLVGVDSTMAALAPLPAADDWAGTTVLSTSSTPAFGLLDARALQTGQVQGEFALQATVLRIDGLPPVSPRADSVSVSGGGSVDIDSPLSAVFYAQYALVRAAVRAWEATASPSEPMSARRMVDFWESTLAEHPATDPFGRPMHLSRLPPELVALVDPRLVVSDAAHLPEDVENWPLFVAEEAP